MAGKRTYTDDELAFLREVIPGRLWREVSAMFAERFGYPLTRDQVRYVRVKLRTYAGIPGGRLQPGNAVGAATRFTPGRAPENSREVKVGSERIDKNGYTWVKVCESSRDHGARDRHSRRCWRLKHHLAWEQAHGAPVPEGHAVVFANRDRADFNPDNLVAVPQDVLSTMGVMRMQYYDAGTLHACMTMAKVRMELKRKRKAIEDGKV